MEYFEFAPAPALAKYIKCYWTVSSSETADPTRNQRRIIPDGFSDLIFNFSRRCDLEHSGKREEVTGSSLFLGPQSAPVFIRPHGDVYSLGIRFQPGAAFAVVGDSVHEFENGLTSLSLIAKQSSDDLANRLERHGSNTPAQVRVLNAFFANTFADSKEVSKTALSIAYEIQRFGGKESIRTLTEKYALTRQFISRIFKQYIGLNPKTYSRVVKFNRLLKLMEGQTTADWLDMVLAHNYYDQSHLIGEFNAFTGMTPSAYTSRASDPASFHFSNTAF